jgi:hypothetical protein
VLPPYRFKVDPAHIGELDEAVGFIGGALDIVRESVHSHLPIASLTVTEYVPAARPEIEDAVDPVLH